MRQNRWLSKRKVVVGAVLAVLSVPTASGSDWTTDDTYREVAYQVVQGLDWMQTRTVAAQPVKYEETNVFLGRHPSEGQVDLYFAGMGLVHYAVSRSLPAEYRKMWQYVSIGYEAQTVVRNYYMGVQFTF